MLAIMSAKEITDHHYYSNTLGTMWSMFSHGSVSTVQSPASLQQVASPIDWASFCLVLYH